jgi:tetratricopeptide (TPR) repeat protein
MPIEKLHCVVEQGLAFLRNAGRSERSHALRLQRGLLLDEQGRKPEARRELEAALALRRRHRRYGYTLGTHLCHMGDRIGDMGDLYAAERYYDEARNAAGGSAWERSWACRGLALIATQRGDLDAAEQWAREAIERAAPIESGWPMYRARLALIPVLLARGRVAEALTEGARMWRAAHRWETAEARHRVGRALAEVRLAGARQALGLAPGRGAPTRDALPAADSEALGRAQHLAAKAARWLAQAQGAAVRLDERADVTTWSEQLQELAARIAHLRSLLSGGNR